VKSDDNEALSLILAEGLAQANLSPAQRNSMFGRVLERIADIAPELTQTIHVAMLPWQPVCLGVWTKLLKSDAATQMQVALFRVDPGGVVPAHDHHREEEWWVLQGEVMLGTHRVGQGDFNFAQVGSRHPDLISVGGALLVVRSEIRPA
jgi:quercetin dioxygenase-like cupin family protein